MNISYSIQKVNFFADQFEDKGKIQEEDLIDAFYNFPFVEQFEEAKNRKLTSCFPKIIFKSDCGLSLSIWAESEEGFFLKYENESQESEFYISNEFNASNDGLIVEDIIELFSKGKIESLLTLRPKENADRLAALSKKLKISNNDQAKTYKYKEKKKFKHFTWLIVCLISTLIFSFFLEGRDFDIAWKIYLFFSMYWLPSLLLYFSYWLKNENTTILIDRELKTITYEKDGTRIKLNRADICDCSLIETRSSRRFVHSFRYLSIEQKNERNFVITNLIVEPELIIEALNLHYRVKRKFLPF